MRLVELARVIEAQRNLVGIEVERAKQSTTSAIVITRTATSVVIQSNKKAL